MEVDSSLTEELALGSAPPPPSVLSTASAPPPHPRNYWSVYHSYNFVIPRLLSKWNHRAYGLLRLALPPQHNALGVHTLLRVSGARSLWLLSRISVWMRHSSFQLIHLLRDYFGSFQFGAITNQAAITIAYRFLCRCEFSFLWDECLGKQLLGQMISIGLIFKETAKLIARIGVPFHIPTSNGCMIRFLNILTTFWYCHYFLF